MTNSLSLRQSNFVEFYLNTGNARDSALKAGYSETTANHQTKRILDNVEIAKAIEDQRAQAIERSGITKEYLRDQYLEVYDKAMAGQQNYDRYGKPSGPVIRQLPAAKGALDSLAKLYGHMVDKVDTRSLDSMDETQLKAELQRERDKQAKLTASGNKPRLVSSNDKQAKLSH